MPAYRFASVNGLRAMPPGRLPAAQRTPPRLPLAALLAVALFLLGLSGVAARTAAAGESGALSPLIRPFLLTTDGDTWQPREAVNAESRGAVQRLPTISERVDALILPISVAQPMAYGSEPSGRGGATQRRQAGSGQSGGELPVLLRPFYSTTAGRRLEVAGDSVVVSSAQWLTDTWRSTRRSWGPSLWRPLWQPSMDFAELSSDEAALVAYEQNEGSPLPPGMDDAAQQLPPPTDGQSSPKGQPASDGLAGDEELGSPPEDATLQFLRTATVLLEPGQFQMDFGAVYSLAENDLPLFLAPDVVAESRVRQRQLIVPLEFRYGLVRNTQVFVSVPLGWANTELAMEGLEAFENTGGIGDVRSGATVLLKQGTEDWPDITATFSFTAPTGSATILTVPSPLTPANMGDGFWALAVDLLMIRNIDPVIFFYGVGTRQRIERTFDGVVFQPGGEYSYLLGAGFAANEKVTLSSTFAGAYVSELHLDDQRVPGTIQEPMSLRFAATIARRKMLIEPFVEFGLTDDATSARFGIVWTH